METASRAEKLMRPMQRSVELSGDDEDLVFHGNVGKTVQDFEEKLANENMTKEESLDNVLGDPGLKVPLPDDTDYTKTERDNNKVLFIYTDFEPDDIFAIACYLQSKTTIPSTPPVVVFTVDFKDKDKERVFEKKLMLATFCLGYDFMKRLIIVSQDEPFPNVEPDTFNNETHRHRSLQKAVDDFVALAEYQNLKMENKKKLPSLEFFIMAPGRGNLAIIGEKLEANATWKKTLHKQAAIHIYSGNFNIKGMETEDFEMMANIAKNSQPTSDDTKDLPPIMDVAHFPYVGGDKMLPKVSNLAPFCPTLGNELFTRNPYLAHGWQMYAEKFDRQLLDPFKREKPADKAKYPNDKIDGDHPSRARLWAKGFRELESKVDMLKGKGDAKLEKLQAKLTRCQKDADKVRHKFRKNFWDYIIDLHKSPLLEMIGFKKRIVVSLAKYGYHEGPLCDCLCYLNSWLLETRPNNVDISENRRGNWWYTKDGKVPTGVGDPGKFTDGLYKQDEKGWYYNDGKYGRKNIEIVITDAQAVCPKLAKFRDAKLIDEMSNELRTRILKRAHLKESGKEQLDDVLDDSFFEVIDSEFVKDFLERRQKQYQGLSDVIDHETELDFFKTENQKLQGMNKSQVTKKKVAASLEAAAAFKASGKDHDASLLKQDSRSGAKDAEGRSGEEEAHKKTKTLLELKETLLMRHIKSGSKWKQKWLPACFMKNIEHFNWETTRFAGKRFLKGLRNNPIYMDSLPPEGSTGSFETKWEEKIIRVGVTADTKFIIIASEKKIEMERLEDLQNVLKYKPKEKKTEDGLLQKRKIKAVAFHSTRVQKWGGCTDHVHLFALVLEDSIQLIAMNVNDTDPTVWETKLQNLVRPTWVEPDTGKKIHNIISAQFSPDGEYLALAGAKQDKDGHARGSVDIFCTKQIFSRKPRKQSMWNITKGASITPTHEVVQHKSEPHSEERPLPLDSAKEDDFVENSRGGLLLWASSKKLLIVKKEQSRHSEMANFSIDRKAKVHCQEWSPFGDRLVIGSENGSAAVYVLPKTGDPEDWRQKWERIGGKSYFEIDSEEEIATVAFSGDGCKLCVARSILGTCEIFDAVQGSFIGKISIHRTLHTATFSQDGTRLAIGCRNQEKAIRIYDAHTGKQLLYTKELNKGARLLSFSPCGTFLVATCGGKEAGEVKIVRPETGHVYYQKKRLAQVCSIASSKDGKFLAYGCGGKGAQNNFEVAIVKSGAIVHSHPSEKTPRIALFADMNAKDGKQKQLLITVSSDAEKSKVMIRDTESWQRRLTISFPGEVNDIAATSGFLAIALNTNMKSDEGEKMANTEENDFYEHEHMDGSLSKKHKHSPWFIPWSSLERRFSAEELEGEPSDEGAIQGFVKAVDLTRPKGNLRPFPSLGNIIMAVDLIDPPRRNADLQPMIAYGGLDHNTYIYDIPLKLWYPQEKETKRQIHRLKSITGSNRTEEEVSMNRAVEAGDDIWNPNTEVKFRHHFSFDAEVRTLTFSPDGLKLAVGGSMEAVFIYHTNHGEQMQRIVPDEDTYSLSFSAKGSYLAVGGEKLVTISRTQERKDTTMDSSSDADVLRLNRGNRAFVAFCCETNDDGDTNSEDESKLIVGSWDKTLTVFEKLLINGAPIAAMDEEPNSIKLALKLNPLLPVITRFEISLVDRSLRDVFKASGSMKTEKYNTVEAIMNTPMGPMAIQPRHFLLAIVERDQRMLVTLLKGACSSMAPQRLRFDTVKMIPFMVDQGLEAALAEVFRDLRLEDTGCEMHAIDCRKTYFSKFAKWFSQSKTPIEDEEKMELRTRNKDEKAAARWKTWLWLKCVGGRQELPLHTDVTKASKYFDHFYPWKDFVEEDKGVLARPHRVALPALASRAVLSKLVQIPANDVANSLFGSDTMHMVIKSVYTSHFAMRHYFFTAAFVLEIWCWIFFCLQVKYFEHKKEGVKAFDGASPFTFNLSCAGLIVSGSFFGYHEILQQLGQNEREGVTEIGEQVWKTVVRLFTNGTWDLCDWLSQLGVVTAGFQVLFRTDNKLVPYGDRAFLSTQATVSLLLMMKFVSYLRGAEGFAWLTVVIVRNFYDIKEFLLICIFIIIFAAGAFTMLTAKLRYDDVGVSDRSHHHDDYYDCDDEDENCFEEDITELDDDTVRDIDSGIFKALVRVYSMGMLGAFSTKGFDRSAQPYMTYVLFVVVMLMLQIVALNALIAILSESFTEVLGQKKAKVNMQFANLMVEYMDTWQGPLSHFKTIEDKIKKSRFWMFGGSLLELETDTLWTHILQVSDVNNIGDITPIDQVKRKVFNVEDELMGLKADFALEQIIASSERDDLKRKLDTNATNASWQRRSLKHMISKVTSLEERILEKANISRQQI